MSQTFTFNYPAGSVGYIVDMTGTVTSISVVNQALTITVTQNEDGGLFAAGETVTINNGISPPVDAVITGVTPTGMIVNVLGSPSSTYLTTDREEFYAVGDVIPFSTTDTFPVCFVRGTLLDTLNGPVAIENLQPGDQVLGSKGVRTVKWIGWRNYGAFALRTEEQKARIAPVRICKHALADNVPSQDLLISPWHHLYIDSALVRANDLINGTTIVQDTHVTSVSYYHVELDQFDVVIAHGVYSESYADGGNRDFFQNVDVTSLRPEDKIRRRASRPGFDDLVLRKGKALVAIQKRIAQRAKDISDTEIKIQKAA